MVNKYLLLKGSHHRFCAVVGSSLKNLKHISPSNLNVEKKTNCGVKWKMVHEIVSIYLGKVVLVFSSWATPFTVHRREEMSLLPVDLEWKGSRKLVPYDEQIWRRIWDRGEMPKSRRNCERMGFRCLSKTHFF